jgi:hypothetical protein
VENSVWASEFSGEKGESRKIEFAREKRICQGARRCVLRFA